MQYAGKERAVDEDLEAQSTEGVEPAERPTAQAETEGLAAVLGLDRNEKDAEAIAKAEQNRRNA